MSMSSYQSDLHPGAVYFYSAPSMLDISDSMPSLGTSSEYFNGRANTLTLLFLPLHLVDVNIPMLISLLVTAVSAYLIMVYRARFRRVKHVQKGYGTLPSEFKNIDYKDAQNVLANLFFFEVPWMFMLAQDYAVMRAFGMEDISRLSVGMVENTGLRYSDTLALGVEWILNPLDSERAILTINRVNFIHSRHKGVENDQMLYTLCLLMCQILQWIDKYEWRATVPLERHASYVFWKEVGIRLGIQESTIPGSFEECIQFIKDHEVTNMKRNKSSMRVAEGITRLYQATLPKFARPLFTNIFISLMDDNLRDTFALTLDTTSPFVGTLTPLFPLVLRLRALFVRYCLLPRTQTPTAFSPASDGEHTNADIWQMMPYYARETWWSRWGPGALYRRAFGLPIPGSKWVHQGYKIEEIGYGGRGGHKVLEIMDAAKGGACPFSTFGRVKDERELGGIYAKFGDSRPASAEKL